MSIEHIKLALEIVVVWRTTFLRIKSKSNLKHQFSVFTLLTECILHEGSQLVFNVIDFIKRLF